MSITDIIENGERWLASNLGIHDPIFVTADDDQVTFQAVALPRELNALLVNAGAQDLVRMTKPGSTKLRRYLFPGVGIVELEYTRKGKYMQIRLRRLQEVTVPLAQMSVSQLQQAARDHRLDERGPEYEFAVNAVKLHGARRDLLMGALTDLGVAAVDVSGAQPVYVSQT